MKRLLGRIYFILFIGVSCYSSESLAQERMWHISENGDLTRRTDSLMKHQQYDEIIHLLYTQLHKDSLNAGICYDLACMYALKGDTIQAFSYLYKSFDTKNYAENILTDTDFESLYLSEQWKQLTDTLNVRYLRENEGIEDKDLSIRLWRLGIEDQRFRTYRKNYKKKLPGSFTPETALLMRSEKRKAKMRAEYVLTLLNNRSCWFLFSEVGMRASLSALYIIQHSQGTKYLKYALPFLKEAVKKEPQLRKAYALMSDRYLIRRGKKQLYGTHWYRNVKGTYLYAVEDIQQLNERRASVGLNNIEDDLQKYNIQLPVD